MIMWWHLNHNKVWPEDLTHIHNYLSKKFICLMFMQRMRALETVSLNKTVGSLFHALVTDGMRDAT